MDHAWKNNILSNHVSFNKLQTLQRELLQSNNGRENLGTMIYVPELLISMLFMSVIYLLLATIIGLYLLKIIRNNFNLANGLGESKLHTREKIFLGTLLVICVCRVVGMPLRAFGFNTPNPQNLIILFGDFPIFLWLCCFGLLTYFWMKKCLKIKHVQANSENVTYIDVDSDTSSNMSVPLLLATGAKALHKEHKLASKFQYIIIMIAAVWFVVDAFSYLVAGQMKAGQSVLSEQVGTFLSNVSGLASLALILLVTFWAVVVVYKHVPKGRFSIEKGLSEANQVIYFFVLSILTRFIVTISVLIHDWISSSRYVYLIYPFYYFVVEWWPIMFLLYKLIFSQHNYTLSAKPLPVFTYPGIDISKTNVFFGKRGHTLYALKYTTISEVKVLQRLRMKHPNIINYIDHEQVEVEKTGRRTNRLRLLLEFVPPIPREASTLINYIKQGYHTISKRSVKEHDLFQLVRIAVKIAKGIAFLHDNNTAHLDIKYDNVLVMDVGMQGTHTPLMVKIIDFEDAEVTDNSGYCYIDKAKVADRFRHFWVDPELLQGGKVNGKAADVFSFGNLMFIIFGHKEFVSTTINNIDLKTSVNAFEDHLICTFEEFPKLSQSQSIDTRQIVSLMDIFKGCTDPNPEARLPMSSVLEKLLSLKKKLAKRRITYKNVQIQAEELEDQ